MYRVALRLTGNEHAAEDLVQDAMLRAFRAWPSFTLGTNARAWLLTILRNLFISNYRRRQRRPDVVDIDAVAPLSVEPVADQDPEGAFFAHIIDERVLKAIDALPEVFREAVVLSDMEGIGYAEIAALLEVPVGTVKSRLHRGRHILQGELRQHAIEMGYLKRENAG